MVLCVETVFQRYRLLLLDINSKSNELPKYIDSPSDVNINSLFQQFSDSSELDFKQLTAICIVSGPGSYTGIRISYAFGSALSFALGIPLTSINTHELLRETIPSADELPLLTLIHARAGELFYGCFNVSSRPEYGHLELKSLKRSIWGDAPLIVVSNNESLLKTIEWKNEDELIFVENLSHETLAKAVIAHFARHGSLIRPLEEPFYQKDVYIR